MHLLVPSFMQEFSLQLIHDKIAGVICVLTGVSEMIHDRAVNLTNRIIRHATVIDSIDQLLWHLNPRHYRNSHPCCCTALVLRGSRFEVRISKQNNSSNFVLRNILVIQSLCSNHSSLRITQQNEDRFWTLGDLCRDHLNFGPRPFRYSHGVVGRG